MPRGIHCSSTQSRSYDDKSHHTGGAVAVRMNMELALPLWVMLAVGAFTALIAIGAGGTLVEGIIVSAIVALTAWVALSQPIPEWVRQLALSGVIGIISGSISSGIYSEFFSSRTLDNHGSPPRPRGTKAGDDAASSTSSAGATDESMRSESVGPYLIAFQSFEAQEPPRRYAWAKQHAELIEEFDLQRSDGDFCYLIAGRSIDHPILVLAQRHDPTDAAGFEPGVLVVPETDVLFVGAGERLLAYDLARPARLWEDVADTGFWGWARYGEVVTMSAELELAAWNIEGTKLWTTFAEPPWSYQVTGDILKLDIMGVESEFSLRGGPGGHSSTFDG